MVLCLKSNFTLTCSHAFAREKIILRKKISLKDYKVLQQGILLRWLQSLAKGVPLDFVSGQKEGKTEGGQDG